MLPVHTCACTPGTCADAHAAHCASSTLWTQVSEKAKLDAAEAMLRDSGVLELEQRVLHFLVSNAASIKLGSTLDDAERLLHMVSARVTVSSIWPLYASIKRKPLYVPILTVLRLQVANGISTESAALHRDVQDLQLQIATLHSKLDATLQRFGVVQQDCLAVETDIVDEVRTVTEQVWRSAVAAMLHHAAEECTYVHFREWLPVPHCGKEHRPDAALNDLPRHPPLAVQVRARLGFLKERLTRTISLVLDAESQPPPHGRWRSVWEKARAFVTRQDQDAALQHKLVCTSVL